jgi:hypothetical protein
VQIRRKGTKIGISKNPGGCAKNDKTQDWRSLIDDKSAITLQENKKIDVKRNYKHQILSLTLASRTELSLYGVSANRPYGF